MKKLKEILTLLLAVLMLTTLFPLTAGANTGNLQASDWANTVAINNGVAMLTSNFQSSNNFSVTFSNATAVQSLSCITYGTPFLAVFTTAPTTITVVNRFPSGTAQEFPFHGAIFRLDNHDANSNIWNDWDAMMLGQNTRVPISGGRFNLQPGIYFSSSLSGGVVIVVRDANAPTPIPAAIPISVYLDGSALIFDVPPMLIDGRVFVPMRAIFEALGAEVAWDADTQTATGTKDETVVVLPIGSTSPMVNGAVVSIDTPGVIIDGRTLVPLRFVAESFGVSVEWDGDTRTVTITS